MSLAAIISSMPSVESRIRTGYSNLSNFSALAKPIDITSVTAEPISVRIFMKRPKASLTKAPPKAVPSPVKSRIQAAAATRSATARPVTIRLAFSPE